MTYDKNAACVNWLVNYMQENKSTSTRKVIEAGKNLGFTENDILAARKYLGKLIIEKWIWKGNVQRKKLSQTATEWLPGFLKLYPPKNTKAVENVALFVGYTLDELKTAKKECHVVVGDDDIWRIE